MMHVLVSRMYNTNIIKEMRKNCTTRVHALHTWYNEEMDGYNFLSSNPSIITSMYRHILFNNFLNAEILKPDIGNFTINVNEGSTQ